MCGKDDDELSVSEGLFAIADAIGKLAVAVERLGVKGAITDMGAIEVLALEVKGLSAVIEGGFSSLEERQD